MTTFDVQERFGQLQAVVPELRLYALVDGVQYEARFDKRLQTSTGLYALFSGTPDAALCHAGPWLIDVATCGHILNELRTLEVEKPSVTWLVGPQDLVGLAQLLQLRLDARLPDGRSVLLRFWDPRVLLVLVRTLDDEQRNEFFNHIHEWLFLHDGQRLRIGRPDAPA